MMAFVIVVSMKVYLIEWMGSSKLALVSDLKEGVYESLLWLAGDWPASSRPWINVVSRFTGCSLLITSSNSRQASNHRNAEFTLIINRR